MEQIKKLSRDKLYKIVLDFYDGCQKYLLIDANDNKNIYAVLKDEDIE